MHVGTRRNLDKTMTNALPHKAKHKLLWEREKVVACLVVTVGEVEPGHTHPLIHHLHQSVYLLACWTCTQQQEATVWYMHDAAIK